MRKLVKYFFFRYFLCAIKNGRYLRISTEKFILFHHIYRWSLFLPKRFKYNNTDGRSMWTEKGYMLKNKPYLVAFY